MKPLAIAIAGCGRIAFEFELDRLRPKPASHFGAIQSLPELYELQAVCDPDPERLSLVAQRHGITSVYPSLKRLLANQVPDVVVVSSPTASHVPLSLLAIQAGVRAIVVEKPVSASLLEARRLLQRQYERQVPVLVFHERRYDPLYNWLSGLIQAQTYGTVQSIYAKLSSASFPRGDIRHPFRLYGGGSLVHDGTHMIDILQYWLGPLQSVSARLRHELPDAATETSLSALLLDQVSTPVYLDVDGVADYFHFELDVFFRQARARIGNGIRELSVALPARQYSGFQSLQTQSFPPLPAINPFVAAYQDLYRSFREGLPLRSSLADGVSSLERIYGIYRSCARQGRPVTFPLPSSRHPFHDRSFFQSES